MIVKKKKSLLKRFLLPLILLVVFAGLLVGAILLTDYEKEKEEENKGEVNTIEKIEGEGDNQRLFPPLVMSQINRVSIDNLGEQGKYSFMRYGEKGEYYFFYDDGSGTEKPYLPFISSVDSNFSYSSLLATEAMGSTNVSQIYNLTTAVGNVRFSERMPLLEEGTARDEQLKTYGLADGQYKTVSVWYQRDKESEAKKYTIRIGSPVITGTGYYMMLEGRDYIYAAATGALDICMEPYTFFIAPRLTAAGLPSDPTYMPYLTPAFKHWKNTWVREVGKLVTEGSRVIVHGVQHTPIGLDTKDTANAPDGYIYSTASDLSFNLANLTANEYARLQKMLVGRPIGDYSAQPLLVTLIGDGRVISLTDKTASVAYEYRISKVESVLTEDEERESGVVGDDNLLKVSYDLYVGGEKKNAVSLHSVINITEGDENPIPKTARDALRALTIGETLSSPIDFTITYTKDNTRTTTTTLYLENILAIYDQNGKSMDSITENSVVTYRYHYVIDGERQKSYTGSFNMKLDAEGKNNDVRDKFLGLEAGKLDTPLLLSSVVEYEEVFRDFISYEIAEVCYFVERECIVSFSYLNASERNPFYGDSLYQNFTPGKNSLYSLNAGTCDTIAAIFGGMGNNSSTTLGLLGNKTVAVGLTPEVMEAYGLYAHTVYYELPRGLISLDSEDENTEDFDWYEVLGFTLYISEEKDGIRYVGCDLYDTVVEISAENFVFVDYDFVTFWARRQLVLVDVNEISKLDLEFNMSDLKGKISFDISTQLHELQTGGTYTQLKVNLTPSGGFTNEYLEEYLSRTGGTYIPLDSYYDYILGGGKETTFGNDYAGAGYYKEAMQMLFFTTYLGMLDEGDRDTIANSDYILKMRVKLREDVLPYVFEFYRLDDRRVGVRLYSEWKEGEVAGELEVCDFYITTFAMKKVVNAFLAITRAEEIDTDSFGYGN